ncbi:TnsA-like heteromeric transposase endonuclease subunit [Streptomyces sp. NBC_00878]|uniref:TnsA-like heteromeric transposase endonuclease subunit n=1 Tax=Streptomyces sp. NBC_00878 TaxID=2975854 RepID=UPI002251CCBA|nr:TnsA-like heteromeric transposase endonuclease subunit [Streptomyces sp. NBC_00878]MCX4906695.1 TnsA-like heteromeric transposase endonuclease subunit [Streptomyces sp. NBC_00878]
MDAREVSAEDVELEYVSASGARERGPLCHLWPVRFESVRPERRFPAFRGQGNWCGWYWSATCGGHVGYESWLERDRLMLLDFDPLVAGMSSQPFQLSWAGPDGKRVRHPPQTLDRQERQHAGTPARRVRRPRHRPRPESLLAPSPTPRPAVTDICEDATARLWRGLAQHHYRLSRRAELLNLAPTMSTTDPDRAAPWLLAAGYPERVALISLFASAPWRQLAASDDLILFTDAIAEFDRSFPTEARLRGTSRTWLGKSIAATAKQIETLLSAAESTPPHPTEASTP